MSSQKEALIRLVDEQRAYGRSVVEVLATLGVKRSTYYRWKKSMGDQTKQTKQDILSDPWREEDD